MKKLLILLTFFISFSVYAIDREISVKGESDFKIHLSGAVGQAKGGTFEKAAIVRENDAWVLKDKKDQILAQAVKVNDELQLKDSKSTQYTVKFKDEGYSVFLPTTELLNRVKIKEDKFNLYNKDAARLLHGKQKEDGFGVKDEKGEQKVKIKGVSSLKEASFFALQIPPIYQIVFWASMVSSS